ncbi:MAG: SUMF1/EgtB/PvdO family nonheme iron enzyme [Thermoguttaceae bacterium]
MYKLFFASLSVCVMTIFSASVFAEEKKDAQFQTICEVDAWNYDRSNFALYQKEWRNGGPIVIASNPKKNGDVNHFVEYDIPFPKSGNYRVSFFIAMHQTRPLTFSVDEKEIGKVCGGTKLSTSWNSSDAIWDDPITFSIVEPGIHTIRLETPGVPPHLAKFRLESDQAIPDSWKCERPNSNQLPPPPPPPVTPAKSMQSTENVFYEVSDAAAPNPAAIRRAIVSLMEQYGAEYKRGAEFLAKLDNLDQKNDFAATKSEYDALRHEALVMQNPAIDFEQILFVRRHQKGPAGAFPANYNSNSSLPRGGYDDEIMALSIKQPAKSPVSIYKPPRDTAITDLDLNFDADKILFSAIGENNRWHIFELETNFETNDVSSQKNESSEIPKNLAQQITSGDHDVDFYDACYLPDGRIMLTCTAAMVGVPCVAGGSHVANLFLFDPKDKTTRQIGFDQEHNWCPTILNNGRVIYSRWEYADTPHSNTRLLFHCNPDGTNQLEYYGSNSYWPTSIFFARPIPGHPTEIVGVVGGHHDNGRIGELVILDPAISRREADGAVQRLPGFGKSVEGPVADGLTRKSWPKFAHPFPISQNEFLVTAQPDGKSLMGIYLIDRFDNMILLGEMPQNRLVEPIPLKKQERPPIIPDRVDLSRNDAEIFVQNVLEGPGLKEIPPGIVKKLRVYTYHYSYHGTGGLLGSIGQDGPWDVRGVLGTVPVEADGSASFRVPANLPFAILPLDEKGQSLQLMRSWMTAMPGENLQCNGCHEPQNSAPPRMASLAAALRRAPSEIEPYNRPNQEAKTLLSKLNVKGFSFNEKIQPILDKHCFSCHNGEWEKTVKTATINDKPVGTALDGKSFPINLRGDIPLEGWKSNIAGAVWTGWGGHWSVGYDNLQRFVRRAGIESDYHLLAPMEYAANTTELVQLLSAPGKHYGAGDALSEAEWQDIFTWIDMNAPFHGNWTDITGKADQIKQIADRRESLAALYGAESIPFEDETEKHDSSDSPIDKSTWKTPDNHSFDQFLADKSDSALCVRVKCEMNLRDQWQRPAQTIIQPGKHAISLEMIPAGMITKKEKCVTINKENEIKTISIEQPFLMGTREITNAQFREFDPHHDSGRESRTGYQFGRRGYDVNDDDLPVVRVTWNKAKEYCKWLSEKTGRKVDLPTQEQWEFACRGGEKTPFWFGDFDSDFSTFENLGDVRLKEFVACTTHEHYTSVRVIENPNPFDDRFPKDERFDDKAFLQISGGNYKANPFGLFDMHGNVAEWTRTQQDGHVMAAGGSWFDRPIRSTADSVRCYYPFQPVFNVGFRIVIE